MRGLAGAEPQFDADFEAGDGPAISHGQELMRRFDEDDRVQTTTEALNPEAWGFVACHGLP